MCPSHQTTYHCFITISPKLETSSFQSNAWERLCAFHTSLLLRIITIRLFYKFSQKPKLGSDKEIFSFYPGLHCSNSWFWVMHIDAYNNITVPLWTLHPEGNQIFFARYCLKKVFHFFPLSWGRTWCNFSLLTVVPVIMEQLTRKVWKDLLERKKEKSHGSSSTVPKSLFFSKLHFFLQIRQFTSWHKSNLNYL